MSLFSTDNPISIQYIPPTYYHSHGFGDSLRLALAGYKVGPAGVVTGQKSTFGKLSAYIEPTAALMDKSEASEFSRYGANDAADLANQNAQRDWQKFNTTIGVGEAALGAATGNAGLIGQGIKSTIGGASELANNPLQQPDRQTAGFNMYVDGGAIVQPASSTGLKITGGKDMGTMSFNNRSDYDNAIALLTSEGHKPIEQDGHVVFPTLALKDRVATTPISGGTLMPYSTLTGTKEDTTMVSNIAGRPTTGAYGMMPNNVTSSEPIKMIDTRTGDMIGTTNYGEHIVNADDKNMMQTLARANDPNLHNFVLNALNKQPIAARQYDDGGAITPLNTLTPNAISNPSSFGNSYLSNDTPSFGDPHTSALSSILNGVQNGLKGVDLSNVGNVATAITGLLGATNKLPVYSMPSMFTDYVNKLRALSDTGFSPQEYGNAQRNLTGGLNADLYNIRNLSGGNSAFALGNSGGAVNRYLTGQNELAANDAALQRQNLARYGGAVSDYTNLDRQMYEDKLNQAVQAKQAYAKLASDSLGKLQANANYNKQYGTGSAYSNYLQSLSGNQSLPSYDPNL